MARFRRHRDRNPIFVDAEPSLTTALGSTFVQDLEHLGAQVQRLDDRLASIEARLAEAGEAAATSPDNNDVLDAEVRSAKLAAELHLVTMELRGELSRLTEQLEAAR